jgi:hypothetical protein
MSWLGPVGRGVAAAAETLQIAGAVGGNVNAQVERLLVEPSARIAGGLAYTSQNTATVPTGTVAGGTQFTQSEREDPARERDADQPFGGLFDFFGLVWLIGSVIAGVLLVHFLPRFAHGAAAQVRDSAWPTFGIGILALFVVPAAILFAAITLVGLPISLVATLTYLLAMYGGWLIVGLAVGQLLLGFARRQRDSMHASPELLVVLGLAVVYVLTHLPFIGGLLTLVVIALGMGAVIRQFVAHQAAEPSPPPAQALPG